MRTSLASAMKMLDESPFDDAQFGAQRGEQAHMPVHEQAHDAAQPDERH